MYSNTLLADFVCQYAMMGRKRNTIRDVSSTQNVHFTNTTITASRDISLAPLTSEPLQVCRGTLAHNRMIGIGCFCIEPDVLPASA